MYHKQQDCLDCLEKGFKIQSFYQLSKQFSKYEKDFLQKTFYDIKSIVIKIQVQQFGMQKQQISSKPYKQQDTTSLKESLYFRTRNGPQMNQQDKVNYLTNDYWDLIFKQKVDPTKDRQKAIIQANKVQSIIISFSGLRDYNVAVIKKFLSVLLDLNKQIKILLITNFLKNGQEFIISQLRKDGLNFSFIIEDGQGQWKVQELNPFRCLIARKKIFVHGKLWVIKYKKDEVGNQKLRTCVATSNFSFDWTVGGNGFWKRDFTGLKSQEEKDRSNKDFKNSIQYFLLQAISSRFYPMVSQVMSIDFGIYYFDGLENIHLIICPPQRGQGGLQKIRRIVKEFNRKIGLTRHLDSNRNINVISPFIHTGDDSNGFVHFLNHFITAFFGIKPRHRRSGGRITFDGLNFMKPIRIFELTKKEAYLANKYEIQTKSNKISKDDKSLDLLQVLAIMRRDSLGRQQAFDIIKDYPENAEIHRLYTQQSEYRKYSNFTAHHTKLILCTHRDDRTDKKVSSKRDILFLGSQNFTTHSWGKYDENGELECGSLELGVLILVPRAENATDYIPIKFNTSSIRTNVETTTIKLQQIFNLTPSKSVLLSEKKRYEHFNQLLAKDQTCQAYKRMMKQKFQQIFLKQPQTYRKYELVFDEPISIIRNIPNDPNIGNVRNDYELNSVSFIKRNLFGNRNWFEYLRAKLGNNFRKEVLWIADIAVRQRDQQNLLVVWWFAVPTFYAIDELKSLIGQHIRFIEIQKKDLAKIKTLERQKAIQAQIEKAFLRLAQNEVNEEQQMNEQFQS